MTNAGIDNGLGVLGASATRKRVGPHHAFFAASLP